MTTIEILKALDIVAMQANRVWRECERLKIQIAKESGIPERKLKDLGIYTEDKP